MKRNDRKIKCGIMISTVFISMNIKNEQSTVKFLKEHAFIKKLALSQ